MTENISERTLLAILALEPEDGVSPEKDVHAFAAGSLLTLATRVEMYLRAMHNGDAGTQNHTGARDRILAAMATDLENDAGHSGKGRGATFLDTVTGFFSRARKASPSAFRRMAAPRSVLSMQRTGVFAAMTGAFLICCWSGAWFYALHSLHTTIAGWQVWEGKSGRQFQTFATPRAALQAGLEGFRSGNPTSAIEALKYAAAGGELLAQWKLAKIYANGDGVPRDEMKAYDYFSQIVTNYDEGDPNRRDRAVVSSALVSLGIYNLNGIDNSEVRPDPQRALQMFQFAATNFGDADAQYNLARMHLDGAGVDKDGQEAIRWLFLAADKGHLQAEALLGQTLFTGREGVPPQRALGLMWLTLAREAAIDSKKDKWIIDLYAKAVASANDGDRRSALAYLEDHLKRRN